MENYPLIKRILETNCPFVAFWFPWYWRKSDIAILRKIAGRWVWQNAKGTAAKLILILKVLLWPLIAVAGVLLAWLARNQVVSRLCEKGKWVQLREIVYFSFWRGFSPIDYYDKRIYLLQISQVIDQFLGNMEINLLNIAINSDQDYEIVNNKHRFAKRCIELNIPAVSTIAAFSEGAIQDVDDPFSLPSTDLYFKPVDGLRGRGIERWDFDSPKGTWKSEGTVLTEENLIKHFKETSKKETFVLQEAAYNHKALENLSTGGLVTFRVMTVLGLEAETMKCYIVMPRGKTPANHGTYGGIVATVNLETNRIYRSFSRLPILEKQPKHPETGGQIEGREFKEWPELEALALKAHKCFPEIFSIGWDLALTTKGPQIVEGNTQWGAMAGFIIGRSSYPRRYLDVLHKAKEIGDPLGNLV
jgi:hypothetical protein